MPPKQKQVKKGPAYKLSTPLSSIVPQQIKQPPRQPKLFKIPQNFPQSIKNNQTLPAIFQQWPSEQVIKTYDFGLNSENKYLDPYHEQIGNYLQKQKVKQWKHFTQTNQQQFQQEQQQEQQYYEQTKRSIQSIKLITKQQQKKQHKGICVIQTYLRPQNQQEMQARLKQEAEKAQKAAKQKKKAPKKQQPKQQGPIQVSDVKMSDIITRNFMTLPSIWIGSQLQIIKQRNLIDVNNNEAVWKKIYPQQNGVPQITKSGKYWVKLLYMGKYIKVQVDDRIPIDQKLRQLFPFSNKLNQKWTLIITKALIKYFSKINVTDIVGNGLVIYALTGMITENIPLLQFKQWQKIQDFMSNQHYMNKDIVLGCFSQNSQKNFKKIIKVKKQFDHIKSDKQGQFLQDAVVQKCIDTKVINGYSYGIGDYFDNKNFNMVFSQQKSQKQMLLKHEYNQLCKISIANKSRQQKLQYRKKKKQLKQKVNLQQKKRMDLINKPPVNYHFFKLLSKLKIQCEYGQKQILLAKKCLLNNLNQPPNYDIPINLDKNQFQARSVVSVSVSNIKYKQQNQLFPNIHDFTSLPNVQQLLERKQEGVWIQDLDLLQYFDQLQVMYNPNIFKNKKLQTFQSKKSNTFTYDQSKQILVVQKSNQQQENEKKVRLLYGYSKRKSQNDQFNCYSMLQKFDFNSFRVTSNVMTLNKDISCKLIQLKNQNSVFKINTMCKGNFNYWISCDSPVKLLSISDYLLEYEGYNKKNITFEYAAIDAFTYSPLIKLQLKQQGENNNTIILKLINAKQQFLNNVNFRLVSLPQNNVSLTSQQIQGIIEKPYQKLQICYDYTRFQIQNGKEYYLLLQAQGKENIPDGALQLLVLIKQQGLTIQQCEQVEPVKFIQKYNPNKYGLICKQRLFTNTDNNLSLTFKIAQFQQIQNAAGGKAAKKGGKQQPSTQLLQKPFNQKKSIIVKIYDGQSIIYESIGINQVNIPNIKLLSTKNAGHQYSLQCYFDLKAWPQCISKNQITQKLCWIVQIISQDSVAVVRDTKQEDKQKQTRKSWQDSEPGRAQRAKKVRRRFLIQLKKQNGQKLTEQQQQILNAPRLTKKQLLQQQKKNEQAKKGKGAKKQEKKGGKDVKKQQVVQQKVIQKQPPKSKDNFMNQLKQFLQILQNCVVRYQILQNGEPKIRSQEQLRALRQSAKLSHENRVGQLVRTIQKRESVKITQKQKKQSISIFFSQIKSQIKQKYNSYIQWRNQDIQKDRVRLQKQKLLIDIINQQKPTISETDLKKNIAQYKQINGFNVLLADVADMVRKNIKINNLSDKINQHMTAWEVEELKNINNQIINQKIEGINPQTYKQFKQMLQEVQKNPNLVAQKQAQAKKNKKGGKK